MQQAAGRFLFILSDCTVDCQEQGTYRTEQISFYAKLGLPQVIFWDSQEIATGDLLPLIQPFSTVSFFSLEKWDCSCPKKDKLPSLTFASFYPFYIQMLWKTLTKKSILYPYKVSSWLESKLCTIHFLLKCSPIWTCRCRSLVLRKIKVEKREEWSTFRFARVFSYDFTIK